MVNQLQSVLHLMKNIGSHCPCHSPALPTHSLKDLHRRSSQSTKTYEYAFEMATSSIRYGSGVTKEVGMDLQNMKAKKVAVFTDKNISKLLPFTTVIDSLSKANVNFVVFDQVRVEPTDSSLLDAIAFARFEQVDTFVAVGGGSVIDTAKAANLYLCHPENQFLDFVNSPIGKGLPINKKLKPLIAIPTTAGTGSETTGVSIFDYEARNYKTGIANRALKPTLGLIDPLNTKSMPPTVHVSSGLDVLCHSLESYTAIPYNLRSPRPTNPLDRPAYQGSNPISDVWSLKALEMCVKNLESAYKNPENPYPQEQMILAATFAGVGFGNAGVHLCHGMSYPISGLNKSYLHKGYEGVAKKLVPHGISVAVTAPAVFKFTAQACPERHLQCAKIFGVDISQKKKEDAGIILSDAIKNFLYKLDVPNGIKAFGFGAQDVEKLVEGTLPQHRVTKLSPEVIDKEKLARLFEDSITIY
ncbi:Hydroxyacid-oxoacid transhydrogenase, mitochondrial [Clydaea vesicula]|uniref:Hydroxyacid-oxoacid transhydrogenase, mitochondrial n=1 Tax=Clydaea vesicula TaxID=447962 RepID=A0AAD5TVT5_9FUNG|nr:Hydroxyacid-oxoacid transhydrogenase, mitochondrial [Clydaea vesicula]